MSEINTDTSTEVQVTKEAQTELPIEKTFSEAEYKKIAERAAAHERELAKARDAEKQLREALAKQNNDYKSLYEQEKKQREEYETKEKMLREGIVYDKKYNAVITEALRSGLRKEAQDDMERLSLEELVVEATSTGKYNILGVEQFVANLKTKKPHWFEVKKTSINPNTPEVTGSGSVSWDDVKKAREAAVKSGDWSGYHKLQLEYAKANN